MRFETVGWVAVAVLLIVAAYIAGVRLGVSACSEALASRPDGYRGPFFNGTQAIAGLPPIVVSFDNGSLRSG